MRRPILLLFLLLAVGLGLRWFVAPDPPEVAAVRPEPRSHVAHPLPEPVRVRCENTLGLPDGTHELIELLGGGQGRVSEAVVADGQVELDVSLPAGHGGIYPVGWESSVVAWEDGRCRFLDQGRVLGAVVGVIDGAAGLPPFVLHVTYCGDDKYRYQDADADGGFYLELPAGVPCTLSAMLDGDWPTAGPPVEVVPTPERDTVVTLVLPPSAGGLGIVPEEGERDDGLAVYDVLTGTPAARAGLRPGDVILEVDGAPVGPDTYPPETTRLHDESVARWLVRGRSGDQRLLLVGG